MTVLRLRAEDERAIIDHAERAYPEECCGILVGRREARRDHEGGTVERVIAGENTREPEAKHNRYEIDPRAILAAEREARADSLEIVGYYHSHPDHPAVPSEFDRDHAWPRTSYLIVSVHDGRAVDRRSWRLLDDRSGFAPEELAVAEQATATC